MNTAYVTEQKIVQANSTNERYFMFDIVRIICALFIFGRHAQTMAGFSFGMTLNNLFIEMTGIIMTAFFALSGFSLYISNGGGGHYLKRRNYQDFIKREQ